MAHRFSQNGKSSTQNALHADPGEYVKNEVDHKLDRINELWLKLEKRLLTAQPARRIACLYHREDAGPDGDITERRFLGIQRQAGKWRLCYAIVWGCVPDERFPWKPIVECDMETRADAVRGVEQLNCEVQKTRTVFIPTLDKAISALEAALDTNDP